MFMSNFTHGDSPFVFSGIALLQWVALTMDVSVCRIRHEADGPFWGRFPSWLVALTEENVSWFKK